MKKVTSALALAALIGSPAAFAQQVEFGGDFDARYYNGQTIDQTVLDGDSFRNEYGNRQRGEGFDQRIRLMGNFESEGGVEVHTRLNLMNDRWTGDTGGGVQGDVNRPYSDQDHRNVELDYGYVSIPLVGGRLNVGRQIASWGHGLTLTDDRRDRISYVRPLGGHHTLVVGSDRRSDGDSSIDTDYEHTGTQYTAALLGPLSQDVTYGFLVVQWAAGGSGAGDDGYAARGATLVSPFVEGESGDLDYKVGGHYIGNSRGAAYTEDSYAGYVKSGFQLTPEFKLEGQVLHAAEGVPVDSGYDTYSSLIHSSPNNDRSATQVSALNLGGVGNEFQEDFSRTLVAARATYEMMDWTFMGSAGWVNYEGGGNTVSLLGAIADAGPLSQAALASQASEASDADESVTFLDLQVHYAVTPSTTIYATGGYAMSEDYFEAIGYEDKDVYATSINLSTQF